MKALVSLVPLAFLVLTALSANTGCDSGDEARVPTQAELVGLWVNEDAGTTRAFEFVASVSAAESAALSARPFVYTLYFYDTGATPVVAQRGFYTVTGGQLVTEVVEAPLDPTQAGKSFGNDIQSFSASAVVLKSPSSATGARTFVKAARL